MKASETNLQAIIEGTKQYIIPMFQRTYSWNEKQWGQLWNDIVDLIEDAQSSSHFIGSIVSIPINANPHGVQQFLVIDGQQRLTTLLILLSALRDVAKQNQQDDLAEEIHHTMLVNSYKKGEEYFKFLPTQIDKDAFKKILNKEDLSNYNDSLIVKAYTYYYKQIDSGQLEWDTLKLEITNSLTIVSIVLSPDDNPYVVFESLNAKGQPLTEADLIRNYLFMRIPSDDQEEMYSRYWLPMQQSLGDKLTEFIRHYLLGLNINVKKNDVYIKLKEQADKQDVIGFLKKLVSFAEYYSKLLDPSKEKSEVIQAYLYRIGTFEATTTYPFLLYIYRDYSAGKYSLQHFKEILFIIENYLVRRFVCSIESKQLSKIFASLYNQISTLSAEDSIEELKAFLQLRGYPKDVEVKANLSESVLYGQGDRRNKCNFVLSAIESNYGHKEKVDLAKVTVEHIMPQTLTEVWYRELGQDAENIHETYLHTLGNLTLTGYNSELSNESFVVKKKYYAKSNLQLNRDLIQYNNWNLQSIQDRSEKLINDFLSIWSYFGKKSNEKNKITGSSPRLLMICDQRYVVKTWRDVMEKTILFIYEHDLEGYQEVVKNNAGFISENVQSLRTPKQLNNGHYMEVNLSAKAIYNFSVKIFEEAGNDKSQWHVETEIK